MDEELKNIFIMSQLVNEVIADKFEFSSFEEACIFYEIACGYFAKLLPLKWQKEKECRIHHLSNQE